MWTYTNLDSAIRPHLLDQILIPIFSSLLTLPEDNIETLSDELHTNRFEVDDSDFEWDSTCPGRFIRAELSDLFRDLNLPMDSFELLDFRLNYILEM